MSTSTTHQQSLADASSETRPLMLERGLYVFKDFTPLDSQTTRLQTEDDLIGDDLKHYEFEIEAMKQRELEKSYDPLALVAHMSSSSGTPSPYYVHNHSSVIDYDDDYQRGAFQNNSKDPLTSAMMLLARAITQRFSNPTNNRLRTSSNTRNQAIMQADKVNIQSINSSNDDRNTRR
ncbi:hypothetical protein Tco_0489160 [Tanacetum coccineum]